MTEQIRAVTSSEWRDKIMAAQALLDQLRPQLVDAEAHLADQLAAIRAFEFRVRAQLQRLTQRLDKLQREIDELRREMHARRIAWETEVGFDSGRDGSTPHWEFSTDGAASSGSFRYRDQPADFPSPVLPADQLAELRQLYRQLARRFHPDLALDEEARARRTVVMMSINAAYSAGDLGQLKQIALEPDISLGIVLSDEELAVSLAREIERCRRRLAEIENELAALERHESTMLLRRSERAAAEGRDLLDELAQDLRRRISEKMVERDVLQTQLEEYDSENDPGSESLADIVYDLGLEEAGDAGFMAEFSRWRAAKNQGWRNDWSEDDIEDILDDRD